jgi:hypothetical protein
LSPCTTTIGLGTVGLGERCKRERKLLRKENFARWCQDKAKEEYQRRLVEGGSTPKKPQTSKEVYVARKNAHLMFVDKLQDQQAESARRFREATNLLKSQHQNAKKDDAEFTQYFVADLKEDEQRRFAQAFKASREKERQEELSARQKVIKEQADEEHATFEALAEAEKEVERARIAYDHVIATTIDANARAAQKKNVEDKHALVKKIKESLNRKQSLRLNLEKGRVTDAHERAKIIKTENRDRVALSVDKMMEARILTGEKMRDESRARAQTILAASSSPRGGPLSASGGGGASTGMNGGSGNKRGSSIAPTSPGYSGTDTRRQLHSEHLEVIEASATRRRENASLCRTERAQHLAISSKDKDDENTYRKELHDYVREMKLQSIGSIQAFQEAKLASVRAGKPPKEGSAALAVAAAAPPAEEGN